MKFESWRDRIEKAGIGIIGVSVLAIIFALLSLAATPDVVEAQRQRTRTQAQGYVTSWDAQTATGATSALRVNAGVRVHTLSIVVTGAPAACTARLQGSNDGGTTWFNITASDITCTSSIATTTVDVVALDVRFNVLTLSGGTSPTVRAHYAGL